MIEVEITNYESIAHAKFIIDGFTTIVGRNSLGKSAVLRAVNAALTNQQGTDFIRWGEKFCEIHIKTGGLDVLWHKEENNNFYRINGKPPQTKIGRDEPPKEILEAGYKIVRVSSQKINLNYADQFNPLFLVDKMDSKGADLLTSVYGLDRLYKAIDLCSKEQRGNRDELRLREKDLELVDRDLKKYEGFDKVKEATKALHITRVFLDNSEKEVADLKTKYTQAYLLAAACKKLAPAKSIVVPDVSDIQRDISVYRKLLEYLNVSDMLNNQVKRLQTIFNVTIPAEFVSTINTLTAECSSLYSFKDRYESLSKEVSRLSKIKDVSIPAATIDAQEITKLRTMYDSALSQKKVVIGLDKELQALIQERDSAKSELDKYDTCPLCGKPRK